MVDTQNTYLMFDIIYVSSLERFNHIIVNLLYREPYLSFNLFHQGHQGRLLD